TRPLGVGLVLPHSRLSTFSPVDRRRIRNMDTALITLVSLLVAGVALGFYMDWFGLWVSKGGMREQINGWKERVQALGKQIRDRAPETGAKAKEVTGTEASATKI